MQLRKAVLIQELQLSGHYIAFDGRLLSQLTLDELEREKVKFIERDDRQGS
ncbi:Fur-regulated basic protein FbpA [Alkalihalobacterium alkalinitrilicum]|uniref:Fur-regulated basic protein FbpA n=1 Tax=Alkalihalobacterium alkalinitrilicum TaxID=427920 RepID=UPI000995DC85|nr:Fur-regulated basic protein FbpA [Alkalihalobacterium alkalinitrilicum]